jgi:non-lysosomal glucosylceramidase
MTTKATRTFDAAATAALFPLGGIGTGNVSLGARGELRDWEIFNSANKGCVLPNTFFALRAQFGSDEAITRVIEGPLQQPHNLSHGYHPISGGGLPRMATSEMVGEYPFAQINFSDPKLPLDISLEAFNPLIPLNPEDSGIPTAILTYRITNRSEQPVNLTVVGSLANPVGGIGYDRFGNLGRGGVGQNVNDWREEDGLRGIFLRSEQFKSKDLSYGDLALSSDFGGQVTYKRAWLRGAWFDFLQDFWDDLHEDGLLTDFNYDTPSAPHHSDTGSLGLVDTLQPGASGEYRFFITWSFPNRPHSWGKPTEKTIRNHYATRFENSWATAQYLVKELPRLTEESRRFQQSLFDSTLPASVVDALAGNIPVVRSPTCFWLEDGRFMAYEGCFDDGGSCDGNCTHVWSYAYTVAYLFPSLEREMRRIEFVVETEEDGYMTFRTYKTFGDEFVWSWGDQKPEAAVDGQMGSILRVYREWLLSGNKQWLETVWPGVKRAIDYAGKHWDTDNDGLLDGRQHNTYDIEFYGPNPLCGIHYLAGLRAVEELAKVMGEPELAARCRAEFERGSPRLDEVLWNGEYYVQRLDDINEHKYQHATGCLSDQLLAQLHARALGLGDLLPVEHVRSAIKSVHKYNFLRDFTEHVNCQRTYALNDEAGLLLCSWPHGGRPRFPFPYSDEVWTGIEYQVAAHLIYEGWVDEGLEIVDTVRDRQDGYKRSPWNEVECGHHYARSMASWALLIALSGAQADVDQGSLGFAPVQSGDFRSFWSTGTAWGSFSQSDNKASLEVRYGSQNLKQLSLGKVSASSASVSLNGSAVESSVHAGENGLTLVFSDELQLGANDTLAVSF